MSREHPILHLNLSKKKRKTLFDRFIIVAAVIYPISTIPQIIEVFDGNTAGISLLSWAGYVLFATLFLIYGLMHKVAPMIIGNTLWVVVDCLVIAGVLIDRM